MKQAEIIIKACNYGKHILTASIPSYHSSLNWRVEWLDDNRFIIHLYRLSKVKTITMQVYWMFTMLNQELCYDNGYGEKELIRRYNQVFKNSQTKITINEKSSN